MALLAEQRPLTRDLVMGFSTGVPHSTACQVTAEHETRLVLLPGASARSSRPDAVGTVSPHHQKR
eukprot:4129730-Alexandrium_andersonii.AAC.1